MSSTPQGAGGFPGLVILFCQGSAAHEGSLLPLLNGSPRLFGRGPARASDAFPRVLPVRHRRASFTPLGPIEVPSLSREQLELCASGDVIELVVKGQNRVSVNGREVTRAVVRPGDLVEIGSLVLLLCVQRPRQLSVAGGEPAFGQPDDSGILGESPPIAELRRQVAFVAARPGHVLIQGQSGTGKELVARALHRLSGRPGELVARNAATIPDSLIDAELFGNLRNYPNPGMQERRGLVGMADRGTLFLDEFAELPVHQQTHLLRVMDAGEYQRLGESASRQVDLRVVGATNRPPSLLKEDLLARFSFTLQLTPLSDRREDIPLLLRHLGRALFGDDPSLARFFDEQGALRLSFGLVRQLVTSSLPGNVRDLRNALWASAAASPGATLDALPATSPVVAATVATTPVAARRPVSGVRHTAVDDGGDEPSEPVPDTQPSDVAAQVQDALDRNNGSLEKTWRELGLSSRFALSRLVKKHGLVLRKRAR